MSAYTDARALANQAQRFTREQWAYETNISNTSHQREVNDLKAAGLNPVLSSGGSGANYTSTSGDSGVGAASNLLASARQAAATRYAAKQQADATRAAAQAQIAAAQIAAAASVDVQKRRNWQQRWNALYAPMHSVAGVADKYGSRLLKSVNRHFKVVSKNHFLNNYLKPQNARQIASINVKKYNFYGHLNNAGKDYINGSLRLMGFKKPTLKQRNLLARYIYSGSKRYYNALF